MTIRPAEPTWRRARKIVVWALSLVIVVTGVWAMLGGSSVLIFIAACVPWLIYLRARMGGIVAVSMVILLGFWSTLAIEILTHAIRTPMLATAILVLIVVGLGGCVLCWREPDSVRRPAFLAVSSLLFPMVGSVVWFGVMVAAQFVSGAARLSWVMLGDSANNVLFARGIIATGGIGLSTTDNPVPLPAALMAAAMASGRGAVSPQDLLRHDIASFSLVWALLVALTCFSAGFLAGVIVRRRGAAPWVVAVVSGAASLVPISWFYTGYPIEFGFFNTHVTLPIVFFAFVAYLEAERRPALALSLLFVASTLLLAVWSPLVLMAAALGVVVVVRHFRAIRAARGAQLVMLIIAAVQLLAYGLGFVLPGLLHLGYFLTSVGGAFDFRRRIILALAIGALVLAVLAFRKLRDPVVLGTVAIVAASAVGLGALLFVSRDQPSPWTYYPLKFSWLASTIIVVLIVGLAPAVVVRYLRRPVLQSIGFAVIAAVTVAFLAWTPSSSPGYSAVNPAVRVLGGSVLGSGDQVADRIFQLSDPRRPSVQWHTGDPYEGSINFWVLQILSGPTLKNLDLKYAAYGLYGDKKISVLCKIVRLTGGDATVYTAQAGLQASLDKTCPAQNAHVVLQSKK